MLLKKGTLWQNVAERTEHALRTDALLPLPTDYEFIEDRGIRFFVRILSQLKRKDEAKKKQQMQAGEKVNPFLPYENDLFVADISDTHVAILNKYYVMKHHLLIITRDYEDQETFLTLKDFEALCICLNEFNGLGYYNGGEEAGASQSHKHLQIVPLPLTPEGPDVPIEPLLATARFKDGLGTIPAFPFLHVLAVFNRNIVKNSSNAARDCFDLYGQMLRQVIMEPPDAEKLKKQSGPYCLLIAREWMLLVPRSCEFFESISINSLGFAGALLVRDREQLELLRKSGPMKALQSVALPGKGSGS